MGHGRPVVVGALLMIVVSDKMRCDEHQIYQAGNHPDVRPDDLKFHV